MIAVKKSVALWSQKLRSPALRPSGSTRMPTTFWMSAISIGPFRTSNSGFHRTVLGSVGAK